MTSGGTIRETSPKGSPSAAWRDAGVVPREHASVHHARVSSPPWAQAVLANGLCTEEEGAVAPEEAGGRGLLEGENSRMWESSLCCAKSWAGSASARGASACALCRG